MIRKMSNPAMAEDKSAGIQQLEDLPLPVAACPLSPDQPCDIISVAAENKSPKSIHNVQCKAWKFLYVVHCTTVSQPAFEIYLSKMLNMNRPKNITYMAVMYDIRQMPRKSNQANVTIEGFVQGRLYASTLKKWLDFEWSPVWGGLCRDPEFHDFCEASLPYRSFTAFGELRNKFRKNTHKLKVKTLYTEIRNPCEDVML